MEGKGFIDEVTRLAGCPVQAGDMVQLEPDVMIVSDIVSKGCLDGTDKLSKPQAVEIVIEHGLPSVIETGDHHRDMVRYAAAHRTGLNHGKSISYFDLAKRKAAGEKIQVAAVCGTRIPMLGMEGIIGVHVTPQQMAEVLEKGTVSYAVPDSVWVHMTGTLKKGVSVRDASMKLVSDFADGMCGKNVIFSGSVSGFTLEERLQFANYISAAGAVNAWIETEKSEGVVYGHELDLSKVCPMTALPGDMKHAIPVDELEGEVPFRLAFIGGCGGGTIEELRIAAAYLRGKKIAYGMRLVVGPVDQETYLAAAREGLISDFIDAGAVFMNPGCLNCTGISCGRVGENEVELSTGSVNTDGCCGAASGRIYLASAQTVAIGALKGVISRELGDRV